MPKVVVSRYIVLGVFTFMTLTAGNVRFTNLKCNSLDTTFSIVEKCNLKLIRRGVVGLNITVKLLKIPVTNVSASCQFELRYTSRTNLLNSSGSFVFLQKVEWLSAVFLQYLSRFLQFFKKSSKISDFANCSQLYASQYQH